MPHCPADKNLTAKIYKEDIGNNLLDQKVIVDALIFNYINTGISQAVRIQMTLSYSSGNNIKTANFQNTIILRGSY